MISIKKCILSHRLKIKTIYRNNNNYTITTISEWCSFAAHNQNLNWLIVKYNIIHIDIYEIGWDSTLLPFVMLCTNINMSFDNRKSYVDKLKRWKNLNLYLLLWMVTTITTYFDIFFRTVADKNISHPINNYIIIILIIFHYCT